MIQNVNLHMIFRISLILFFRYFWKWLDILQSVLDMVMADWGLLIGCGVGYLGSESGLGGGDYVTIIISSLCIDITVLSNA